MLGSVERKTMRRKHKHKEKNKCKGMREEDDDIGSIWPIR